MPRKGVNLFARGINPDLTSKKTRCVLNERDCILSPIKIFFKKRAVVASFQTNLHEWKLDPALPIAPVIVAKLWN